MNCAKCDTVLRTKDTRTWVDNERGFHWVERKRACPRCGDKPVTIELPIEVWNKIRMRAENE